MKRRTGFICDESYFWHHVGSSTLFVLPGGYVQADGYAENPETKRRFKNLLERTGLIKELVQIEPRMATKEEIKLFHGEAYIDKVKKLSDSGYGDAGELALVGKDSYEIALLSTGGALTAVEKVIAGEIDNAYALTRPPGHHAEASLGMGFCLFNNVAIAAKYAKKHLGIERILILDWDVHHGNGTESAFYDDLNVLFISLHQERNFPPNRGTVEDVGEGAGEGYNINIPLPAGTGNAGYMYAMEEIVGPITDQFKPELILISAGQDAGVFDPLARMMVTTEGYKEMIKFMLNLADKHCDGKIVACHEGGYSTAYVPFCSHAIVEQLSGIDKGIEDPFYGAIEGLPTNELYTIQKEYVDKAKAIHSKYWDI